MSYAIEGDLNVKPKGNENRGRSSVFSDDRGQSQVLGFILVIGIVVGLVGINQVVLVPSANEQVEFKHSQQVQNDMVELRTNLQQAASSSSDETTSLTLGPQYPQRFLAINPGQPSGTLRNIESSDDIVVENVKATDQETDDFWDGSFTANYPTGRLVYTPGYNIYEDGQSHVVENSLMYSVPPTGSEIVRTEQSIVRGKRINLVGLEGSYYESTTGTVSAEVEPLSASSNRISVQNVSQPNPQPIRITLQTELSESKWVNNVLDDELDQDGGAPSPADCDDYDKNVNDSTDDRYVVACDYDDTNSEITLTMEEGVTYSLKSTKLGVGSQTSAPTEEYITLIGPNNLSVEETGAETFTVEVRDEYNNPVSGVQVNVGTKLDTSNSTVSTAEDDNITDEDGRVTFVYDSGQNVDNTPSLPDLVNISYTVSDPDTPGFDPKQPENAQLRTFIENTDQSGLPNGTLINPAGAGSVILTNVQYDNSDKKVTATFKNNDTSQRKWDQARVAFIDGNQNGNSGVGVLVNDNPQDELIVLDEFEGLDEDIELGTTPPTETVDVEFHATGGTQVKNNVFVLQVKYENRPGVVTYFIYAKG